MKYCNLLVATNLVTLAASFIPSMPFHKSEKIDLARNLNAINNSFNDEIIDKREKINRRLFVENVGKSASVAILSTMLGLQNALAADSGFQKYEDLNCGFEVSIPDSWIKNEQNLSDLDRRKLILYVDPDSSTNSMNSKTLCFISYSSVRDDYTSLGSFGSVDQVAQATVLPKGKVGGGNEDIESELISAIAANNAYYFDYTITPEKLNKIHFRSVFYLASQGSTGGAGSYLVTVTAQTPETEYLKRKDSFDQIISSFRKSKKA